MTTLEATAHHEAGHFVIAVVLDRIDPQAMVSIRPRWDVVAWSATEDVGTYATLTQEIIEDFVVISFAGYEAERRFDPNADPAPSAADNEKARRWIAKDDEPRLRARARQLVEQHWGEIERLAAALLRYETLDLDEAMFGAEEGPDGVAEHRARIAY